MYSYYCMAQPSTIKSGNKINDTAPAIPQGYSTFPYSYRHLQTHRYAYLTPHCDFESMEGFKDSFRCMAETTSLSLEAPLKNDIYQKRTNFFVPLQAILPNNWEQIIVQPTNGDDVSDQVNGVVSSSQMTAFLTGVIESVRELSVNIDDDATITFSAYISNLFRRLLVLEMFGSQGSLCKMLRMSFAQCFVCTEYSGSKISARSLDYFIDKVFTALAPRSANETGIHQFEVAWYDEDGSLTDKYIVASKEFLASLPNRQEEYISYDHFLDLARQNLNFLISVTDFSNSWDLDSEVEEDESTTYSLSSAFQSAVFGDFIFGGSLQFAFASGSLTKSIHFNSVSAYQIICAHFFSCDYVDYIYSANLYRELMKYYLYNSVLLTDSQRKFSWNGIDKYYDSLSGYSINKIFAKVVFDFGDSIFATPVDVDDSGVPDVGFHYLEFDYLTALFSFRHNLRYFDYFTGGRTRPLSIGNVGVAVSNNEVNVVDVIQEKNVAKWLNWSMRIGRKFSDYIKGKSKVEPRPDLHDPQWLSGTGDLVFAKAVQNTGAAQVDVPQSQTSNLMSNTNRYQFTYMADRLGYIICITSYDIPRAYAFATGKDKFHANRYDIFNPMLQYNGSQAVDKQELGLRGDTPFAYQGKYMEYKQNYDIVSGGFVERLPGFAFIADVQSGIPMQQNLNPTYIRSWNEELAPFFIKKSGHCLAYRFDFIVVNTNIINAQRPMEYQPQLM